MFTFHNPGISTRERRLLQFDGEIAGGEKPQKKVEKKENAIEAKGKKTHNRPAKEDLGLQKIKVEVEKEKKKDPMDRLNAKDGTTTEGGDGDSYRLRRFNDDVQARIRRNLEIRNESVGGWQKSIKDLRASGDNANADRMTREAAAMDMAYDQLIRLQTEPHVHQGVEQVWNFENASFVYEFLGYEENGHMRLQVNLISGGAQEVANITSAGAVFTAQELQESLVKLIGDGRINALRAPLNEVLRRRREDEK